MDRKLRCTFRYDEIFAIVDTLYNETSSQFMCYTCKRIISPNNVNLRVMSSNGSGRWPFPFITPGEDSNRRPKNLEELAFSWSGQWCLFLLLSIDERILRLFSPSF
jgi:hypothetical protein